jgi:hypothetical protein
MTLCIRQRDLGDDIHLAFSRAAEFQGVFSREVIAIHYPFEQWPARSIPVPAITFQHQIVGAIFGLDNPGIGKGLGAHDATARADRRIIFNKVNGPVPQEPGRSITHQ